MSAALHIGSAAAFTAWRVGTHTATARLVGGSATGRACALYLTAISVHH
ncbi:hypothetical protein ACFYZB_45435 [Streptomyces sp. NPDC001852]